MTNIRLSLLKLLARCKYLKGLFSAKVRLFMHSYRIYKVRMFVRRPITKLEDYLGNQYFLHCCNGLDAKCSLAKCKFFILEDIWVDDYGTPHRDISEESLWSGLVRLIRYKLHNND